MPSTGKSTMKEGARLATTRCPAAMAAFTRWISERTTLAFWGQVTTHWPQRMHSLPMILACWPENSMDFTGQTRIHLWQLLQLAFFRPRISTPSRPFRQGLGQNALDVVRRHSGDDLLVDADGAAMGALTQAEGGGKLHLVLQMVTGHQLLQPLDDVIGTPQMAGTADTD